MTTCAAGDLTCWIIAQSNIITNIAKSVAPVEKLITGGAYLIGIAFAFKALMSLKQHGEQRSAMSQQSSLKEPLLYFLVAAVFMYFPTALSVFMDTTFGYSSVLSYTSLNTNNQALNTLFGSGSDVGRSLAMIIQLIGLIAFIRGWTMIVKSSHGQQQGGPGKGLVHIVGGILAMNIVGTLQVLNDTLYG